MVKEKIKIGTYQGPIVDNDLEKNLLNVKKVIQENKHKNLDFLCFPETYLSGYSAKAIEESAVCIDDPRIQEFIKESSEHDTVILVGMSEKKEDGIYNSQLVIHKGELLGIAHKTMLTQGYDNLYFKTDLELPVFEAKGIKFGIAICHTTSFVEPAQYLRWKGARLLFTPHFNNMHPETKLPNGDRVTYWDHRTMVLNNQAALATLLKMIVVRSNIVVIDKEGLGSGDSNIWNMNGELVAAGQPFTEEVVIAEFDKEIFTREHFIDRQEVPVELMEMMLTAAKEYEQNN